MHKDKEMDEIRFLYYTDPHIRIQNPPYRLDDYFKTILKKMSYIAELGEELEVDAFLCGGDIGDRPDIPYTTLAGLLGTLSKFKAPHYTVLGNHDEYGYTPVSFPRTALSPCVASGLLRRLSMENPLYFQRGRNKVQITGIDAHPKLDKEGRLSDYLEIPTPEPYTVKIHVVHGFLAKKPWPQVPVTVIDDILDTKADIILTGHEHSGFGVIEKAGKIFCNPGALGRVSASVGDVNLEVKVALVRIYLDASGEVHKEISLIPLPIDIARPAIEVIDREALEKEKEHKQMQIAFMASARDALSKFDFGIGFNLYSMLDYIIDTEDVPEEVEKIMRDCIAAAEESLKKGDTEG